MRVKAVRKDQIKDLQYEDWVDRSRHSYAEGNIVWVPVRDDTPCDREIPERSRYQGRGFFMLGDVAILHGRKPSNAEIEKIINFRHPRGVLWIESLNDVTRSPQSMILWGNIGEVCHHESGYTYILDPQKVMFSQGNRNEKMRIAQIINKSGQPERIADMFAGIGYFTIPAAGSGAFVHTMEINPVAFDYLLRNIVVNGLSDRIKADLGDCRDFLSGTYNRIIMGHFDAIAMLPHALRHVQSGSAIHVHSVGTVEEQIREHIEEAGFSASIHVHKIKKYRPHAWHVVQDVIIR